jgi:hypothetical protein
MWWAIHRKMCTGVFFGIITLSWPASRNRIRRVLAPKTTRWRMPDTRKMNFLRASRITNFRISCRQITYFTKGRALPSDPEALPGSQINSHTLTDT